MHLCILLCGGVWCVYVCIYVNHLENFTKYILYINKYLILIFARVCEYYNKETNINLFIEFLVQKFECDHKILVVYNYFLSILF